MTAQLALDSPNTSCVDLLRRGGSWPTIQRVDMVGKIGSHKKKTLLQMYFFSQPETSSACYNTGKFPTFGKGGFRRLFMCNRC